MPRLYPYCVALSELLTHIPMGNNFINQRTVFLCSFFVVCLTSSTGISLPTTTFTQPYLLIFTHVQGSSCFVTRTRKRSYAEGQARKERVQSAFSSWVISGVGKGSLSDSEAFTVVKWGLKPKGTKWVHPS